MIFNRRRLLAGGALLAAALVAGSFALAEALRTSPAPTRIAIQATPITAFDNREPAQTRFGLLEFRGGLALTSNDKAFGGISGIRVEPTAAFLAVTDKGSWLRGRIVYEDGKPIADAEMAPSSAPTAAAGEGRSPTRRQFYIIERVEQIVRWTAARRPQGARRADRGAARFQDFRS